MEFIDTNVLLYAYDTSEQLRHEPAHQLVARLGRDREAAISVQVLQEFYVNATRKIAAPLSPDEARTRLRLFSRWSVHSPLAADVLAATAVQEEHQLSFCDAMIVRSAAQLGCERLWSEDLNDGQIISGVRITNPFTDR